jgi:hypothetical protein
MTDAQIAALMSVCRHEASHAVVAYELGAGTSRIVIERAGAIWMGQCTPSGRLANPRSARLFALAGICAQAIDWWPSIEAPALYRALKSEQVTMTIGDMLAAGDFSTADVAATLALVRKFWQRIEDIAERVAQHTVDQLPQHVVVK